MAMFRNVMVYLGLGPDDEYDENYLYNEGNVDFDGLERRTQSTSRGGDGVRVFDDEDDLGVGAVRPLRPVPDGKEASAGAMFGELSSSPAEPSGWGEAQPAGQSGTGQSGIGQSGPGQSGPGQSGMQHPSAGFASPEIEPVQTGTGGKPDLFESRSFGLEGETNGFDSSRSVSTEAAPSAADSARTAGAFASGPDASSASSKTARPDSAPSQLRTNSQSQNDRSTFGMDEFSQPHSSSGAKPRTVVPRGFDDAKNVANEYRNGSPVVMNLREADKETGRRLLDFSSGMVYGLGGGMEKLAANVFLITPDGVVVSADDRRRLEERGYGR